MSERDLGFLVIWEGRAMWADNRKCSPETRGVLYIANREATIYPTRARARGAILRTQNYAAENGIKWSDNYRISRVRLAEVARG